LRPAMHNVVDTGLHILAQARGSYYMKHEQGQECNEKAKIDRGIPMNTIFLAFGDRFL
jgi:hypothetical protein